MKSRRVVVAGGGAAGFFAAITCAETNPALEVVVLERGAQFLEKVRISGGGRCNVTHACFDPAALAAHYPRGGRALLATFHAFQPRDTVAWFAARGVALKTEEDGRMFPVTDSSQTIIDCLLRAAAKAGVKTRTNCGLTRAARRAGGGFELALAGGESLPCDWLLLATGGCRGAAAGELATSLGHRLEPSVPSLFTFHVETPWVRGLAGVSCQATVAIPRTGLRETGAVLLTHWGLSGPAILRLSAWGARILHDLDYRFPLHVHWLPGMETEQIVEWLRLRRELQPAKLIVNTPPASLPGRLWEQLALAAGIPRETRWAALSRSAQHALIQQLTRTELPVSGKSLNKDEFVTCGGVKLSEVNFKTNESRLCHGLYFAGEMLDVDGLTGGFNFQAAWTTGWLAGRAIGSA